MAFQHKQRVAVRRLIGSGFAEDWTERGTISATKRDHPPEGYCVVRFDHGGALCVPQAQLRAA